MKKLVLLLVFILTQLSYGQSQNLDSLNQYYGWEENTHFIDQKVKFASITYIAFMNNNKSLFVSDSSGCYRIINLETGKLEYISYGNKPKVFAIFKDSIAYSVSENPNRDLIDTIYSFNLNDQKILNSFKTLGGNYDKLIGNQYSFHKSNKIFFSYIINEYYGQYYQTFYLLKVFDFDSMKWINETKVPFSNGTNFLWNSDSTFYSCFVHKLQRGTNNFESKVIKIKNSIVDYTIGFENGYKILDESEDNLFIAFNKSLVIANLKISKINNINLNEPVNQFIIDSKKNRIIYPDLTGKSIVFTNFKGVPISYDFDLKDSLGKSLALKVPNSDLMILASSLGHLKIIKYGTIDSLKFDFSADKTAIIEGEEITFNCNLIGAIDSVKWYFNNSYMTDKTNFKSTFLAGNYNVKLLIYSGNMKDSLIKLNYITVNEIKKLAEPQFLMSKKLGNPPLFVEFKIMNEENYDKIYWVLDSNQYSEMDNPNYIYTKKGTYRVTLYGIVGSDTSFTTKIINVIDKDSVTLRDIRFGRYQTSGMWDKWTTNCDIANLTFLGNYSYAYIYLFRDSYSGHFSSSTTSLNSLIHVNPYFKEKNFKIDTVDSFLPYIDEGIITNRNKVYNSEGKYLFTKEINRDYKYVPDNYNKLIYAFKGNNLYCFNKYYDLIWNFDFLEEINNNYIITEIILLKDNIKVVCKKENGDIDLIYFDKKGNILDNTIIPNIYPEFYYRKDDSFLARNNDEIALINKMGNSIKMDSKLTTLTNLDTLYFLVNDNGNVITKISLYNSKFDNLNSNFPFYFSGVDYLVITKVNAIMLDDNSIILALRKYSGYYFWSYEIRSFLLLATGNFNYLSENESHNLEGTPISPNPATDYIEIRQPSKGLKPSEGFGIEIYNIFGEVQELPHPSGTPSKEGEGLRIDVSNLAPGVYFIKIGDKFEKFIKM